MQYELLIPTRNSARWIGQFLRAYRAIGVEPLYVVDSRSDDATETLLRDAGARVETYRCKANYVEAGTIEFAAGLVKTDWTLRLDDDEFPSVRLLQWMETTGCRSSQRCWNISRLEVIKLDDGFKYSRLPIHYHLAERPKTSNPQPRLYRQGEVTFTEDIHTTGFRYEKSETAPAEMFFIHCDTLLRSFGDRLEKVRRYEADKHGSTWQYGYQYLPELLSHEHNASKLPSSEFDALLASLPPPLPSSAQITAAELEQLRSATEENLAGIRQRRRNWLAEERASRRLKSPLAVKPIAEFICTLAQSISFIDRFLPSRLKVADYLGQYGRDLYCGAEMKKARNGRA